MITINLNFILLLLILGASISKHSYVIVTEKIGLLLFANPFLVIIILKLNVLGQFIIWVKSLKTNFFPLQLRYVIQFYLRKISAATIWQASNVTTNAQRIIVRRLSDFFW